VFAESWVVLRGALASGCRTPGVGAVPDGWDDSRMARVSPLKKTARDMLLSMALIAIPIVLIVEFFPHEDKKPGDTVQTVDYTIPLEQARRTVPFQVLAPEGLPAGWRATSLHTDLAAGAPLRWEIGFASPDGQYVALDQVSGGKGAAGVLDAQAKGATVGAEVTVGGVEWTQYDGGMGGKRRALVRNVPATTAGAAPVAVVVSGSGSFAELEEFAAALK
jgi:hypothetical protein